MLSCRLQFSVAHSMNRIRSACHLIRWRDIADRAVKAVVVVSGDEINHDPMSLLQGEWRLGTNTLRLDRSVVTFNLSIAPEGSTDWSVHASSR